MKRIHVVWKIDAIEQTPLMIDGAKQVAAKQALGLGIVSGDRAWGMQIQGRMKS